MIQTDKKSRLLLEIDTKKIFIVSTYFQDHYRKHQNIYITSDEEIKDIRPHNGKWQLEKGQILNKFPDYLTDLSECKLVIMTTDQDLINDGVQAIDDTFLEWFVNNPSCEQIEVQKWFDGVDFLEYKIIIPKEEQELLPNFTISKDIFNRIADLKNEKKEEVLTFPFVIENSLEYLKLTQRIFDNGVKWQTENLLCFNEEELVKTDNDKLLFQIAILRGMLKQQEKMYSEEEVKYIVQEALESALVTVDLEQWLEQFKKK